jgi:EAL domain-containing protein (putative c-di-GMP-specific phosphodiesterase class I)
MRALVDQVEVTETSLLHDLDSIRKALHLLRNEGFTVAIDDFGRVLVAYALEALPYRHAEDRHLVHRRPETDPGDAAITEAIIGSRAGSGCASSPREWERRCSSNSLPHAGATSSRVTG